MQGSPMLDPHGVNAYKQHQQIRHQENEQRLLTKYAGLVRRIVRHLQPQVNIVIAFDDMEQIGFMALLDVIRRYQNEGDEALERLATQRIRGAILDELRRMDWRSRRYRQRSYELRDAERKMSRKLGREPTNKEIAQELDIELSDVHRRRLDVQAESLGSYEALQDEGEQFLGMSFQCQAHEKHILKKALRSALAALSEREQMMLTFYYEHEMNLKEIALVFELTEARVSQIHKKALKTLQSMLVDWRESV